MIFQRPFLSWISILIIQPEDRQSRLPFSYSKVSHFLHLSSLLNGFFAQGSNRMIHRQVIDIQ